LWSVTTAGNQPAKRFPGQNVPQVTSRMWAFRPRTTCQHRAYHLGYGSFLRLQSRRYAFPVRSGIATSRSRHDRSRTGHCQIVYTVLLRAWQPRVGSDVILWPVGNPADRKLQVRSTQGARGSKPNWSFETGLYRKRLKA
jgi:hypothetical protein